MPTYEVVGHDRKLPVYQSADNLVQAKEMADVLFRTGDYDLVLIRLYYINRWGIERCRVLHRLTKRREG
jgi:hypothetical protein